MDSFPIPESDSLLSQLQASIDLQQEGLAAVLGSIGSGLADGLGDQKKNNDKCVRKLNKAIRDKLQYQNDQLVGVIDQLLTVITALIGEQQVALHQIQGASGLVYPGPAPTQEGPRIPGSPTLPIRDLETPLSPLSNLLGGPSGSVQPQAGLSGPTSGRPYFPPIGRPPSVGQPTEAETQPAGTQTPSGNGGTTTQQAIASLPPAIATAIINLLQSFNVKPDYSTPESLSAVTDIVSIFNSYVQSSQSAQNVSSSTKSSKYIERIGVCMQSCHDVSELAVSATADDIAVGIYVNGDKEIQDEYVELEKP